MSDQLKTYANIKIPYPVEGVIRTAQLDDTVAPENSVQLAVNMNFDRVGAMQSRPGVTSYADVLVDGINSYGTLRNSIVPPGYEALYQLGDTSTVVEAEFSNPWAVRVSATKIAVFWSGADNDGFCQNFSVDEETGTVAPLGAPVEFDTGNNADNCAILISSSRVLNTWTGPSNDGFAQVFDVLSDTITPLDVAYEFDAANGQDMTLAQVDSSHYICFYVSSSSDGVATILAVDGGGVVTEPGSPLTFDSGSVQGNSCVAVGDGTHFINFWSAPATPKAQCFAVNTGTWAITALSSALTFDSSGANHGAAAVGDGTHFVDIFQDGTGNLGAQCFLLNLSTFAITEVGTPYSGATIGNDLASVGFGDGYHYVAFYSVNVGDGFAQMLTLDPSTFVFTATGTRLSGYDFANNGFTAAVRTTNYKVLAVWGNEDAAEGKAAMFEALGDAVNGRWLYAGSGDEIFNTKSDAAGVWTSRRSGLATVSKPRFSQFLNYVWMVNGNQQIGGDPVATSDGGNFGTDLVPDDFPPGDFIHAGFEGRVWVANRALGVIYYTDIVQFVPPTGYSLTYDPDVNFITTVAPQTGQQFTALQRVPRALLVFTEDTITRIYGATSLDAYPAYNVGTYSQESIVETKSGIFFHHSSGFYQFDYGSQPVEISRRIIDFVKAIPRSSYEDVVGVYDGFDVVEWSVGQVTVEGVTFTSCVLRYTISTQVWTVYDYVGNAITAMVYYDDGSAQNHLVGTAAGKTGALDVGTTDFGTPFYFELIDRWRAYTEMYYQTKIISGLSVYSENAAGANVMFQGQKSGPNAWSPLFTVTQDSSSLSPNSDTPDFTVGRLRIAGTTKGAPVVIHGIEITELTVKGQDTN